MYTRRGVILGSASLALAGCGGGGSSPPPPVPPPPPAPPPPAPPPPPPPPAGPGPGDTYRNEVVGYGVLQRDPAGIFDLPADFSYRVIARFGDRMDDGFLVPTALDGMGAIDLGGGQVALIRNHELSPADHSSGPTGGSAQLAAAIGARAYDRQQGLPHPGGTTTTVYDYRSQRVVSSWLSLAGTVRNCSGGVTPWGSWLSCEESLHQGDLPHGWVFEVPAQPNGLADPVPLRALGRFNHEAALVDPVSGIVYLTEDRDNGLFYRLLPASPGRLAAGGRLQALGFADGSTDTRNWNGVDFAEGAWRTVRWIDLDGVDSSADDLRLRGRSKGAAAFARGEGIYLGTGELYFACTSGGAARLGQIMRYVPSAQEGQAGEGGQPGRLQLFRESNDAKLFGFADNLAVAPWSHLILCEDKAEANPVNHLKGVSPEGRIYTIGRNAHPGMGELAGVCFSPDGATLFLNIYSPGMTLAITGPWQGLSNERIA
jgi:secreted PhoX family phosphatase